MLLYLIPRWIIYWLKRRKQQQKFKPVILVTGCGSGIGLAIADLLYPIENYRVVITARPKSIAFLKSRFKESDRFMIRNMDVNITEEREYVYRDVQAKWGGVNILINNAGISYRAVVEHMTGQDEYNQMATNYLGPVGLIRLALPYMRTLGRGKIINVSSVSGMLAMPTMASYTASKYALEGMSEALWYEMRPLGISVTLIQPGFVHSNSFQNVYYTQKSHPSQCMDGPYSDYYANMAPFVENLMGLSLTTPDRIAKQVLKVIQTEDPPLWVPATMDAVVFYYLRRMLPRRIFLPFLFYCLPGARNWAKSYSHKRK